MADRGYWIAVTQTEAVSVYDVSPDIRWDKLDEVTRAIGEQDENEFIVYADTVWWVLHCCLCDGTWDYDYTAGSYPLNLCILGGRPLFEEDTGVYAFYVTPGQVTDVVFALASVNQTWLLEQYKKLRVTDQASGAFSEEDFESLWTYFESMVDLYQRAAALGRGIFFAFG